VAVNEGRVAFQMPRGNLEGIYPKIIMIDQVQKHISNKKYSLAFQAIRTHKLDFNLITDIDPQLFRTDIKNVLTDIKRVDFINLLISQISETLSSELQYILPSKTYDSLLAEFEMVGKGKKIKELCRLISTTLRDVNKEEYVLSIFTAEIREGRVSDVLFEIKEMKKE
jgi:elongator complex protein 1